MLPTAIRNAAGGSSPHATDAEQPLLLHAVLKSVRCRRIQVTQGKLHDRKILYSKKGKRVSSQRENIREVPSAGRREAWKETGSSRVEEAKRVV